MSKFNVNIRDLTKRRFSLETGEPHSVVVSKFDASRIEMADAHFNFDSAVLLPDEGAGTPNPEADSPRITALAVLRACYLHAKNNPSAHVVVAGHTDTVGTPGYNLTLSQFRADNVKAALLGDRDAWVKSSMAKNVVADRQRILRFVAFTLGWNCDPSVIDNEDGPRTQKALKGFQNRYNDEFEASIAVDGVAGKETWGAFFDVYMRELQDLLEVDEAGLAQFQQGIQFVDSSHAAVGCGENHPIEAAGTDEFRSQTNRRVEVLFFEPGHEPKFPCHPSAQQCKPALCEIYRGHFEIEHLPVDELVATQQLLVEWPEQLTPDLPPDLVLVAVQGDSPEVERPWSAGEVVADHRRFTFEPFNPSVPCTLIARTDQELTLWDEQLVNNPGQPPEWEHTLEELLLNPADTGDVTATGDLPPGDRPDDGHDISI
jgi:hypothetical protein